MIPEHRFKNWKLAPKSLQFPFSTVSQSKPATLPESRLTDWHSNHHQNSLLKTRAYQNKHKIFFANGISQLDSRLEGTDNFVFVH